MKIEARVDNPLGALLPAHWDESLGICLPLDHVICHDVDMRPIAVREYKWPWTAYHARKKKITLHFCYWKQNNRRFPVAQDITPEREARIRELQFLMTRQIYYGNENAPGTLVRKVQILRRLAHFAEARSRSVREVLTQADILDAFGELLPDGYVACWMTWLKFLGELDPDTQLGLALASPRRWNDLVQRAKAYADNARQYAPLPTQIYAGFITNLSAELDEIETHKDRLLAALRDALDQHRAAKARKKSSITIGPAIVKKHELAAYLERRGFMREKLGLSAFAGAITEIFQLCKLQIHVFSGMRDDEVRALPYHCMAPEKGQHGRRHCLITGSTTKFNKGRRLRAKWVTTERDGYRAVRLAQAFADVIYEGLGVTPSDDDASKDDYPLFPSVDYLPWLQRAGLAVDRIAPAALTLDRANGALLPRLCPVIEDTDIEELEEIDPFRAWREEPKFAVGENWPLSTHQLRRSLALYANASGLVRISSLRRQLQHMTREMSLYYGRGSIFCKNFVAEDPVGYKSHIALEWQDGDEEATVLSFTREVLNSTEPMFGGAGTFYARQRERGEIMSREEVADAVKRGTLAYRDGPLGGCTRPGVCTTRKGLTLIDTICATDGCKHLVGKHSKVVQIVRLKRASMAHVTPGSITEAMEKEELESLERVELAWRRQTDSAAASGSAGHA